MNNNEKVLLIELTQKCNLNCKYCFYRDYGRVTDEIDLPKLNEILNEHNQIKEIYFTGGECTLAKDFIKIIEAASKKAKITIFTNGVALKDDNFFKIVDKYVSQYIITYDEYSEDYFCRSEIAYTEQCIKNIVKISPQKLIVKICINKFNVGNLENIIKHLSNIGVKKISINMIHNINSSKDNFELDKQEVVQAFEILDKHKDMLYINYYDDIKSFFIENKNMLNSKCKAGKSFFFYDCFGNKKYCPGECKQENCCVTKECISLFEMF